MLDIRLGGLSGIELQQQLGASGSSIPVIFVTGHDDPATRTQALAVGCAGFFSKATPGHTVLRAIRGAAHPGE